MGLRIVQDGLIASRPTFSKEFLKDSINEDLVISTSTLFRSIMVDGK